jgi:hypothetical protein
MPFITGDNIVKAFLSHSSKNAAFVLMVAKYLKGNLDYFTYKEYQRHNQSFLTTINGELIQNEVRVRFIGSVQEKYHIDVFNTAYNLLPKDMRRLFFTCFKVLKRFYEVSSS